MSTPPTGQGIGRGQWGSAQWGSGVTPPPGPPIITPLSPVDEESDVSQSAPIFIRFTDDDLVDRGTLRISVGATTFVLGGVAQNGAYLSMTSNTGNGMDVELRMPERFPIGSQQEVTVYVRDYEGSPSELIYRFMVGVGLRMIQVKNPSPNILVAYFNRPLQQGEALSFPSNWKIDEVSVGAAPLEVVKVMTNANNPDVVTLRYAGGGSTYLLTARTIRDVDGNRIDPNHNSALFEIVFGDEPAPTIRLFDTIYGPVGIRHRARLRRTIDDHVVNRSIALGVDAQFRLRLGNLDGSAGNDGRPGKNRI